MAALQPRCIRYLETAATQRDYPSSYEKRNVVVACCSVPERPETRQTRVFSSLLFRFNRGNRFYGQSSIFHGFSAKVVVIRWMRTTGILPYNVVATLLQQQRNQVLLLHKGKGVHGYAFACSCNQLRWFAANRSSTSRENYSHHTVIDVWTHGRDAKSYRYLLMIPVI